MIFKYKIDSLTEEELMILMYVLSENSGPDFEWHKEYLVALKDKELFELLNPISGITFNSKPGDQ